MVANVKIILAVFDNEQKQNRICIGEGFNLTEAIVRAMNIDVTDEELQNIMFVYGDDVEGLIEWYKEQHYYLSEPYILPSQNDVRKMMY